jgi:hypothetical protein
MRRLAGYLCHRASVRLHMVAARLMDWEATHGHGWHAPPKFIQGLAGSAHRYVSLDDVAPRLAGLRDTLRRKSEHISRLAMARTGGRKGRF